jgi:basic amino acid/polyamine antiporter, APA family
VPRKLGLEKVLGPAALAAVAYGEVGSSLYFALGIVALYALGLTPTVLLIVGVLFLLVSLSYAEGAAAIPETGGAATFVRRAFNDPLGFVTGWVLLLDYLIVVALAGLFTPHYIGQAIGWDGITHQPWDALFGVLAILGLAATRLVRRTQLYRVAVVVAGLAFTTHVLLIALGGAFVLTKEGFWSGVDMGSAPTWSHLAFALPLAMLAYTGLETVANYASETREPGKALPRGLFAGLGTVVAVSAMLAVIGLSAYPVENGSTELGTEWLRAPLVGITVALDAGLPSGVVDVLRVIVGLSGAIVLIAAATTSISGAGRLAYSLARYEMLPRTFARLNRRTLISPTAIIVAAGLSCVLLVLAQLGDRPSVFLASVYSFGVLFAFTAAQVAVIRLRATEPGLERPFRAPGNVRVRGVLVPLPALIGAPLTFVIWIASLSTHHGALVAGPVWVVLGLAIYVLTRTARHEPLLGRATPGAADLVPEPEGTYETILVPLKLGPIGEEVLATAIKLAEEHGARVRALHVVKVPHSLPMDAAMEDEEERAAASIAEAKLIAGEHGVAVEGKIGRSRSIGEAIVVQARDSGADLVVLGSAPRWRRQSRFFSPTVDYVLRHADCEVMVVAYPQGVLEEEAVQTAVSR